MNDTEESGESMMSRIGSYFQNPRRILIMLNHRGLLNFLPEEARLALQYRERIGRRLNLKAPKSFNEKIQWLKLNDHNPRYTVMADKFAVKKYLTNAIGAEYVIPLLGVWDSFEKINFATLPEQFVLKCTHDSGGVIICSDKAKLDYSVAKKKIQKSLRNDYAKRCCEWPYQNIPRRIIAEKFMVDESGSELKDYKLICFNGKVRCSFTCSNRNGPGGLYVNFYDMDWKPMPFVRHYPRNPVEIAKPTCFEEMIRIAEVLAKDIPLVRIDFYQIQGRPYVGEITFYPGNGMEEFTPEEWDFTLGGWIKLPEYGSNARDAKENEE